MVLVVDDSKSVRDRLVAMLAEIAGVQEVLQADGGELALSILAARAPRVVVLDIHMPGPSGLDVLPVMKARPSAPVVILLTNHPTEHHRRQAMELGADHFFDKSRDFSSVCEIVRQLAEGPPG
jgi:DNA-binding NarL/FixJ family response regulator